MTSVEPLLAGIEYASIQFCDRPDKHRIVVSDRRLPVKFRICEFCLQEDWADSVSTADWLHYEYEKKRAEQRLGICYDEDVASWREALNEWYSSHPKEIRE